MINTSIKEKLISGIKDVERIAAATRLRRMLRHPLRYLEAICHRELIYKKTKKERVAICKTFFNTRMHLLLPSGTDIYLTGGKSHPSEIRLAKFLINQLNPGDIFLDVGAHYGYFTLLASSLVTESGKVFCFEASPSTYHTLKKNTNFSKNINIYNYAVSDEKSDLLFYEFPNLYSEYNSLDVQQFRNKVWYSEYKPQEVHVQGIVLDEFLYTENVHPCIIKIDVEGAEYKVVNGLKEYLISFSPIVVIEYLCTERCNDAHLKAEKLLNSLQYQSFRIDYNGDLQKVDLISSYLTQEGLESDNIVFVKKNSRVL
jgi:FkbM family methyltransferase